MRRLKFLLIFLWTAGLLTAAYWRYPTPYHGALVLAGAAGCAALLLLAALAAGHALLQRLDLFQGSWVQELVFSAGLGLGTLSLLAAGVGAAGVLFPWVAWLMVLLLLTLNWNHLEQLGQELRRSLRNKHPWEGSSTEIAFLAVLGVCLAAILMLALAPPSFYDAGVYHLAQAQHAAFSGTLQPQAAVLFTWLPSLPTPLWAWALALDGAPRLQALAPSLLNVAVGLLLLLAVMDASARLLRERRLWLAPALLFSQPLVVFSIGIFSPDTWAAFYVFLGLQAFLLALDERRAASRDAWLLLCAVMLGAATASKAVALLPAASLLALLACWAVGDGSLRRPGLLALALGAFIVPLLPWMLQGLLRQGQPFYPFPVRMLGWTLFPGASAAYFEHMRGFTGGSWGGWLRLPYAFFFDAESLGGGGHLNVLLLALLPALPALAWERPQRWLGAFVCVGALAWALGPQVQRYALPLVPALALVGAQAALQIEGWAVSVTWTWLWRGLLLLGLMAGAVQAVEMAVLDVDPVNSDLGLANPAAYLVQRGMPQLALAQWIYDHGGDPNSRVLLLGDARSAWLPAGTLAASVFEPHPMAAWVGACADPQQVAALLHRKGYDFVVYNGAELQRLAKDQGRSPQYWPAGDAAAEARFNGWLDLLRALPSEDRLEQGPLLAARLR